MRERLVQPRFNLGFSLANGSPEDGRVTAEIGLDGIEKSLEENEGWGYEALHFRTHDLVHQDQTTLF